MKQKSRYHQIPIYDVGLTVVVTESIVKTLSSGELKKTFDEYDGIGDPSGLFCYNHSQFCIMLDRKFLSHDVICHEIFHATIRIATWNSVKVGKNHHEAAAYLNGYISKLVFDDLKRWKLKVK